MYVKMKKTLATRGRFHLFRHVYDVAEDVAASWIAAGVAEESKDPPEHIAEVLRRLDEGAGKPCLFLPPAGIEFGHEIMTPVRLVHFHRARHKVVCCRPGTEVLYPSADEHVTDWIDPISDAKRVGTNRSAHTRPKWPDLLVRFPDHHPVRVDGFTMAQELYPIEPKRQIRMKPKRRGLRVDVTLGVRHREFAPERNWPPEHWQRVARALTAAGYTFAVIGRRDTSYNLDGQQCHSGDYDTDAAVELLQNCRLFVGSDSGAAHLASTVGAPMLVFRHHEARDFVDRMQAVNPQPVGFLPHAWKDPDAIIARMLALLGKEQDETEQAA